MVSKLLNPQEEQEWIDFLLDEGVFRLGEFTLKSGAPSPFFLNFGELHNGSHLIRLGETFAHALHSLSPTPNLLFGPAYKGIPLAVATAMTVGNGCGFFCFRKEAKAHGEQSDILGSVPNEHSRVLLIDDVLTTAGTKLEAVQQLTQHARRIGYPLSWSGVVVGVDRQQKNPEGQLWADVFDAQTGIPVYCLTDITTLLNRAQARGWPADEVAACREYLAQ